MGERLPLPLSWIVNSGAECSRSSSERALLISGAHLNPIVSSVDAVFGGLRRRELVGYVAAQVLGAATGVVLANLMFGLAAINVSARAVVRARLCRGSGVWCRDPMRRNSNAVARRRGVAEDVVVPHDAMDVRPAGSSHLPLDRRLPRA